MSSHFTCCGCWPAFVHGIKGTTSGGRTYRSRAKYNEREYSIEFENLIEEEDFYAPSQSIVTDVERDLLSRGKFGELLQHQNDISQQQDAKLREKEENARMEDEAYVQAKKEASRVAKQAMKKQVNDKSKLPNMTKFDSVEFSKWLSEEKIDITSPELDVEDFESFLEKVRAKSTQALQESGRKTDASVFEQTLSQGVAATKIAGDALNALQPVELHAVCTSTYRQDAQHTLSTTDQQASFQLSSVESSPTQEASPLFAIPDVEVKTDNYTIQTSQIPVRARAPVLSQSQETVQDNVISEPVVVVGSYSISQEAPSQLINVSPVASLPNITDIASYTHTAPAVSTMNGQPDSTIDTRPDRNESHTNAACLEVIDAFQSTSITQSAITFVADNCKTHDLNTRDAQSDFKRDDEQSSSGFTVDQHGKLIDLSPLRDLSPSSPIPTPPIITHTQFTIPFEDANVVNGANQMGNMDVIQNGAHHRDELVDTFTIESDGELDVQPATVHSAATTETIPVETIVTVNTPRNVAANLKPMESNAIDTSVVDTVVTDTVSSLTSGIEVQSFKMVAPPAKDLNQEFLEDSLNDDDFNDFDDDFVSSNTNGGFEDYLT